jgi:hypothetical protein
MDTIQISNDLGEYRSKLTNLVRANTEVPQKIKEIKSLLKETTRYLETLEPVKTKALEDFLQNLQKNLPYFLKRTDSDSDRIILKHPKKPQLGAIEISMYTDEDYYVQLDILLIPNVNRLGLELIELANNIEATRQSDSEITSKLMYYININDYVKAFTKLQSKISLRIKKLQNSFIKDVILKEALQETGYTLKEPSDIFGLQKVIKINIKKTQKYLPYKETFEVTLICENPLGTRSLSKEYPELFVELIEII